MQTLKSYSVWDRNVRWFHWINLVCILGMIAVGVVILNAKTLGVSNDGKILLKTIHVWIGYIFALNLVWRLVWAFTGGTHARWKAILPGGRGYMNEVRSYLSAMRRGQPQQYIGHNPLGRIAISILLLLLLTQAASGLVLAGTDIFYPPFGSWIASWVAAPGVDPSTLVAYAPEMYSKVDYENMRAFRKPFITVHYYGFYVLLFFAALHISAVIFAELREGGSLISAMFSGKKILDGSPADEK